SHLAARPDRQPSDRLARGSALGAAGDHPFRGMEEFRLQHGHLHRGAPDDPRRPVRSGTPRWRYLSAGVPPHHAADAPADAAAREHPDGGRLFSAVRRALRDDAGRAAAKHGERALLHVRAGLQVVGPGFRLGGGVPAVPDDSGGHRDARALCPWSGAPMREPLARWLLHLLLLRAVALTLMPLLWMVAASCITRGQP